MSKAISNIVFTRNRPLQLEGYLESFYRFMPRDMSQTYILYKPDLFGEQYDEVFNKFDYCKTIREKDFNRDFLGILGKVETEYINFGTDDVVYFDSVDFDVIEETFERFSNDIIGFTFKFSLENLKDGDDKAIEVKVVGQRVYKLK